MEKILGLLIDICSRELSRLFFKRFRSFDFINLILFAFFSGYVLEIGNVNVIFVIFEIYGYSDLRVYRICNILDKYYLVGVGSCFLVFVVFFLIFLGILVF